MRLRSHGSYRCRKPCCTSNSAVVTIVNKKIQDETFGDVRGGLVPSLAFRQGIG